VQVDLKTQQETIDKIKARLEKTTASFKEKFAGGNEDSDLQQQSFQTVVYREAVNNLLFTVGQLTNEFPELMNYFAVHLKKANLVIPSQITVPQPLSARSDGSAGSRSQRSSSNVGANSNAMRELSLEV